MIDTPTNREINICPHLDIEIQFRLTILWLKFTKEKQ